MDILFRWCQEKRDVKMIRVVRVCVDSPSDWPLLLNYFHVHNLAVLRMHNFASEFSLTLREGKRNNTFVTSHALFFTPFK